MDVADWNELTVRVTEALFTADAPLVGLRKDVDAALTAAGVRARLARLDAAEKVCEFGMPLLRKFEEATGEQWPEPEDDLDNSLLALMRSLAAWRSLREEGL